MYSKVISYSLGTLLKDLEWHRSIFDELENRSGTPEDLETLRTVKSQLDEWYQTIHVLLEEDHETE